MAIKARILRDASSAWTRLKSMLAGLLPNRYRHGLVENHIRSFDNSAPAGSSRVSSYLEEARKLNEGLNSDVQSIPPGKLDILENDIRSFCSLRGFAQDYIEIWVSHRYRLYFVTDWIDQLLGQNTNDNVLALELGAESPVTDLLRKYFPRVLWKNSVGDLRYTWQEDPQKYDFILCTELIEHVSDLPEGLDDSFRKTGLIALLKECYRTLKPGGLLFITTPNAGSVLQLAKALVGEAPWFYPLHVREYTIDELRPVLTEIGFEIMRCRAIHCMTSDARMDYIEVFEMLLEYGGNLQNRGDDIFLVARKSIGNL